MKQEYIDKYNALKALKPDADKPLKQQRGRDFEKLMLDIFEDEGILVKKSYHTSDNKSEQIDGVVELLKKIFLVESKWVESNLAASDLYAFLGKIDNKFQGTLGIFISRAELSENFLNAVNKGRRQSVIVIHGEDVDIIFSQKVSLKEYITFTFKQLSFDNRVHFPVKLYLRIIKSKEIKGDDFKGRKEKAIKFLKENVLIKDVVDPSHLKTILKKQTNEEIDIAFGLIVKNYPKFWYDSNGRYNINNVKAYLKQVSPSKSKLIELANSFYSNLVKGEHLELYSIYSDIPDILSEVYDKMEAVKRDSFEKFIIDSWEKYDGNYEMENQLTELIRPIWDQLSDGSREILAQYYLDIFLSSRESRFVQKAFSEDLLNNNRLDRVYIEKWLEGRIKRSKESYGNLVDVNTKFIAQAYSGIAQYLEVPIDQWVSYIDDKLKKLGDNN